MSSLKVLFLLLLVAAVTAADTTPDRNEKPYKVVCYFASYTSYRTGDGKFTVEDININICTHLIYAFAKLEDNKIASMNPDLDLKDKLRPGAFERFNNLKNRNPQLSTLISIGGWNEGSTKYSVMAADPSARATFVQSVVDFCVKHNFDGLDLHWKYPTHRGGAPEDKQNFVTLLEELKNALQPEGLLLSAAVSGEKYYIHTAYDVPQVSKHVDFINVLAYDYRGPWQNVTGHHSALYQRTGDPTDDEIHNVNYGINYWIDHGADRKKIILGLAFYGRTFQLANPSITGLAAPTVGAGTAGSISKEPGMLQYNEICLKLKNEGWVLAARFDDPYAYHKDQWIGFDNRKSTERKVNYIIDNNLGGGMVWALDHDDFRGKCHGEYFPLLSAIYTKLNGRAEGVYISPDESAKKLKKRSIAYPDQLFKCNSEGEVVPN